MVEDDYGVTSIGVSARRDAYANVNVSTLLASVAGWHRFEDAPANANKLKAIPTEIESGTFVSPELITGETYYNFSGGTVASSLKKAEKAFQAQKDADGKWLVYLPVFEADDCANPHGWLKIVGVATAIITNIKPTGQKKNDAEIQCDVVMFGKGGGPDYGTSVGTRQIVN
ncbi:MAG: hypothetical protein ACI8TX_001945 [Hyphomicrobiaceae bacterium]